MKEIRIPREGGFTEISNLKIEIHKTYLFIMKSAAIVIAWVRYYCYILIADENLPRKGKRFQKSQASNLLSSRETSHWLEIWG